VGRPLRRRLTCRSPVSCVPSLSRLRWSIYSLNVRTTLYLRQGSASCQIKSEAAAQPGHPTRPDSFRVSRSDRRDGASALKPVFRRDVSCQRKVRRKIGETERSWRKKRSACDGSYRKRSDGRHEVRFTTLDGKAVSELRSGSQCVAQASPGSLAAIRGSSRCPIRHGVEQ
jgi:hypothetical protein